MSEELNSLLAKIEMDLHKKGILEKSLFQSHPVTTSSTHKETEQKILNDTYTPFYPTPKTPLAQSTINPNPSPILSTSNEYETRKLIEKELDPYVNSIKKDLKIQLDSFQRNAETIKATQSELASVKEIAMSNRRDILKLENSREINISDIKSDVIKLSEEMKQKNEEIFDIRKGLRDLIMKNEVIKSSIDFNNKPNNFSDEEVDDRIKQSEERMINAMKEIEKNCNKNILQIGNFFKQSTDETKNVLITLKNEISEIKEESKKQKTEIEKIIENMQENIKTVKISNEASIEEINKKITELKEEIKTTRNDSEIIAMKEEISKLQQEIKTKNSIDNPLPIANNDIITKLNNLSIRVDEFDNKVTVQSSQTNMMLSSKLNELNQSYNTLKNQLSSNTASITELNEQMLSAKENFSLFKSKLDAITSNISSLEEKVNTQSIKLPQSSQNSQELDEIQIKIKEIVDKIEEVNKQYHEEMSNVNSVFVEFKEKQLQANATNEKAIVCLGQQMVTSLKTLNKLEGDKKENEENFEQIQKGFDQVQSVIIKIPKIEKENKLMNKFIVELTKKFQELQIKVDKGFESVTQWESGLVENISKKMNEIIEDYERKINQTSQRLQTNRTAASDSRGLATKDELTTIIKKVDDLEKKVESSRNVETKQNNDQFNFAQDQEWDFDTK